MNGKKLLYSIVIIVSIAVLLRWAYYTYYSGTIYLINNSEVTVTNAEISNSGIIITIPDLKPKEEYKVRINTLSGRADGSINFIYDFDGEERSEILYGYIQHGTALKGKTLKYVIGHDGEIEHSA